MKYEKPQRKNPHNLTVNQHIFPVKSIERFADDKGTVEIRLVEQNKTIRVFPDNALFCAKRRWDHRAETGYMKRIEDLYQILVSKIIDERAKHLDDIDHKIATDFHSLWRLRVYHNSMPIQDAQLNGMTPDKILTKDEEEQLEKNHIGFFRGGDGNVLMPGRLMNGLLIQMDIDRIRKQLGNIKWGIVTSLDGEFIVPDSFDNIIILPIAPSVILLGDSKNLSISLSEVRIVNKLAVSRCHTYYFARNLSNCPIQ